MKLKSAFLCLVAILVTSLLNAEPLSKVVKRADSLRLADNYTAADETYKLALKRSVVQKKDDTAAIIYLRLGIVSERRTLYTAALDYYFESLKRFKKIDSKRDIAAVKINIGNIYRTLSNYEGAFAYVDSAYQECRKLKDSSTTAFALNSLGNIWMDQDSLDMSLPHFQAILKDYTKYADIKLKASATSNLASIYTMKENYPLALDYYQQAYKLNKEGNDKYKMAYVLCNMAILYIQTGEYNKALKVQHESLKLARQVGAKKVVQWGYLNYSEIYKSQGNYRKAYESAIESMAWKDSVYRDVSQQYKLSEANYLREQEEVKNKLLSEEGKLKNLEILNKEKTIDQKNMHLIIMLIISTLTVLSVFLLYKAYRTRQKNERILEKQKSIELESQLKQSELTALRAQMNPHFIFNALSSIKNYMLEQNVQLADYYLGKFAKLIRLILDNSSQNFVSMEKELQLLEAYIQLEQLRFENKFFYEINVDEEINTMETFIPSMIIQPFVENAIIHGFMHKEGKCNLIIDIRHHETFIMVSIKDDGIGRLSSARLKSSSGNVHHQSKGYTISEQRLKVLSHANTANTGIIYKDLADDKGTTGTLVEINIPLEQNTNL